MNQKIKDDLFMARGLGDEPYQKDSRVLIRTNAPYYKTATYRLLVNASGKKHPHGEYYEDEFNQKLLTEGVKGQTFNDKQGVTKRGASEYIVLRNGKEVVVRTWQGTKYTYTAIGKRYFTKQKKRVRNRNTGEHHWISIRIGSGTFENTRRHLHPKSLHADFAFPGGCNLRECQPDIHTAGEEDQRRGDAEVAIRFEFTG
jgi:hypothetical protein